MKCPFCGAEYIIKEKHIGKNCLCDEDERIMLFDNWYELFFHIPINEVCFFA